MAIPLNQLGPYQFITIEGVPLLPRAESEVISRPGVDGLGFLKTGARGKQFSLRTIADVANWATAQTINTQYHQLTNSALVDLIFGGVNYSTISIRFNVLDVEVTRIKKVSTSVGGLAAGQAIIEATWQLVAVKV